MTATFDLQNQSKSITQNTVTIPMVRSLVGIICLTHQREQTDELDQLYYLGLSDLTTQQFQQLPERVIRETEFWPTPAALRKLAGLETEGQRSEREGLEALSFVLQRIRRHGIEGRPKRGALIRAAGRDPDGKWQQEEYEEIPAPHVQPRIIAALEELGEGDLKAGVRQVARHPILLSENEDRQPLGLEISAIEKLERRWLDAWRRAAA